MPTKAVGPEPAFTTLFPDRYDPEERDGRFRPPCPAEPPRLVLREGRRRVTLAATFLRWRWTGKGVVGRSGVGVLGGAAKENDEGGRPCDRRVVPGRLRTGQCRSGKSVHRACPPARALMPESGLRASVRSRRIPSWSGHRLVIPGLRSLLIDHDSTAPGTHHFYEPRFLEPASYPSALCSGSSDRRALLRKPTSIARGCAVQIAQWTSACVMVCAVESGTERRRIRAFHLLQKAIYTYDSFRNRYS